MQNKQILAPIALGVLIALGACSTAGTNSGAPAKANDIGRETLKAGDGWAAEAGGTTGGAKASAENIFTVSSRKELVAALARAGAQPKIIYVKGSINLSAEDSGRELVEKDFADPAYDFEAYKKAYDPNQWNRKGLVKGKPADLSGPLEEARKRSAQAQKKVVEIIVPSNTTIVGLGKDARLIRGNLLLSKVENVIIRNIAFEDAFDYFPAWDPGDSYSTTRTEPIITNGVNYTVSGCQDKFVDDLNGPQRCNGGRWNSNYDLITLKESHHVWIDHCSFSDGSRFDKQFPPVFAAPYNQPDQKVQHHDAAVDITNESDYVTLSYNYFTNHDKLGLIGGSDSAKGDVGKLRVTIHHNFYENTKQRQPRVRFGQVHTYNNLFVGDRDAHEYPFAYGIGLGKEAKVLSQNNVYRLDAGAAPADVISLFTAGATLLDTGSLLNGKPADVLADFNAKNPKQVISSAIGWQPPVAAKLTPSEQVEAVVRASAGAGKL